MRKVRGLLLAAGLGKRLRPFTDALPKCLMPIKSKPILEYWLEILHKNGIREVLVNSHYRYEDVQKFISRKQFEDWVRLTREQELLGTAGTIRSNSSFCADGPIFLAHADNWCQCSFTDFINYHHTLRPTDTCMTMMTFRSENPSSCGIVNLDQEGRVQVFAEKIKNPDGNLANGAVYLIEPEVVQWICEHPDVSDFSTQVLPNFLGRIATWENHSVHRDIGTFEELSLAQAEGVRTEYWSEPDEWSEYYKNHQIHDALGFHRHV